MCPTFGKGKVFVATENFNGSLNQRFFQTIDESIGSRPAWCANDSFELVLREDKHGHRYLFVLNPSLREIHEEKVTVAGTYKQCTDLGVGSGVPVPSTSDKKTTAFTFRLEPGEGTAIDLQH